MNNVLFNESFDGGWTRTTHTRQEFGEIFVPEGWVAYWRTGPAPHDPANPNGYGRPEMQVINKVAPFLDPPRVRSGARALKFFTFYRIHDAGVYQVVEGLTPGQRVAATGWAHAWSSTQDDAKRSDGSHVGSGPICLEEYTPGLDDADRNVTFRVGIDPTGATDPWGESVIWGPGRHIYNAFAQIPEIEVPAEAEAVTVFVRSSVLWPFKHCDAYVDDMSLVVVGEVEEPEEPPVIIDPPTLCPMPRPEWDTRATVLVRFGAGADVWHDAAAFANAPDLQHDVCRSWDHAFWSPGLAHVIIKPWFDIPGAFDLDQVRTWGAEHYPTIDVELVPIGPYADDETLPETNTRRLLGFHGNGEGDIIRHLERFRDAGLVGPTCKAYGQPGAMAWLAKVKKVDPRIPTVGRIGDRLDGYNLAGPSMDDPEASAEAYYQIIKPHWTQHRDYVDFWETINEQKPADDAMAIRQARFFLRLIDLAEADGFHLALFGYSLGTPEPGHWDAIATTDVLRRAFEGGHAISVHEYGRFPYDAGYILGRFADLYDRILLPSGWAIQLLITEYNLDEEDAGEGISTYTYSEWLSQMQTYDALLRQYPWIVGANIFTLGTVGDAWDEFDPDKMKRADGTSWTDGLVDWQIATAEDAPEPQPEPPVGEELIIVDVRSQMATNPQSPWYPWKQRTLDEITHVFVHHSAGVSSSSFETVKAIAQYHTSDTGKNRPGICYAYVIGEDGTVWQVSDVENVVFSQGSLDYPGDENRWGVGVCLLGSFISGREPSDEQMASLILLIERLSKITERTLLVWGHKDVAPTQCPGDSWPWRAGWGRNAKPEPPTPPAEPVLIGFNDHSGETGSGCRWLMNEGKGGLIVQPAFIGGTSMSFDGAAAEAAGIRVIVNLRYSWSTDCGGAGTLPAPGSQEWTQFIDAAARTIEKSTGVWGWTIGNEANNPREFPKQCNLFPADVVTAYNAIRARVAAGTRMSPGALDPFNAQAGDPRAWLATIYGGISGAEFVAAHGYVRGPDATLVGSSAKFADAPLQWQYLNYPGCVSALLETLPPQYAELPVYITEFNHLWKTVEGDWGWVDDERAAAVVRRAVEVATGLGFAGLALYRWAGDAWTVERNASVLEGVKELLG